MTWNNPIAGTHPAHSAIESARDAQERIDVLIAEDEESIAETLAMLVEDAGHTAAVALNGRQALALAQRLRPRLLLTDLMMPYLNGADLIDAVRRDAVEHAYAAPITVLVTAASMARAREAQADAIVSKPFDIAKIEAVLERYLNVADGDYQPGR